MTLPTSLLTKLSETTRDPLDLAELTIAMQREFPGVGQNAVAQALEELRGQVRRERDGDREVWRKVEISQKGLF